MEYDLILGVACFGGVLQEVPLWQRFLEALHLDVKPFNCPLCLTFWVSLAPFIITEGPIGIFSSIVAAVLAELINIQLTKI